MQFLKSKVEEEKLYYLLSDVMVDVFISFDVFIAGGIISRLFSGRSLEGADVDVYFRSAQDLAGALKMIQGTGEIIFDYTDKSVMIKSDKSVVQFIIIDYFKTPEELFNKFDFTCVMGCYDVKQEAFIFDDRFMLHNSQRKLVYNPNTSFPIISSLRVAKYEKEGYKISRTEYLKIMISLIKLEIKSWEDAEKQFGKFYGTSISQILNDVDKSKTFSLDALMEVLDTWEFEYHVPERNKREISDYRAFIGRITGIKEKVYSWFGKYFVYDGGFHNVGFDNLSDYDSNVVDAVGMSDIDKIYKYVIKWNGEYVSQYKNTFKYKIGENAKDDKNGLWFAYLPGIKNLKSNYGSIEGRVLLECKPVKKKENANHPSDTAIFYEVEVIREVPKEEEEALIEKCEKMFLSTYGSTVDDSDVPF